MPRSPSVFRQTDITKALKAVRAAGYSAARVLIGKNGQIEIVTAAEGETAAEPGSDLDSWLGKKNAHSA